MERLIQIRAMRGLDPTPEQDAYLRAIMPEKEARGERLAAAGAEFSGLPQAGRAVSAIGKAYDEPSIPNATNAAVQTALAAIRPVAALKALGIGYGAAAADDLGAFDGIKAEAQTQTKKGASRALPGLLPEQQAEYDALERKIGAGDFGSSADRRMAVERHRELRAISDKFSTEKNAGAQAEYTRHGEAADAAFKREMARDKRFADTTMGKVYEETAGVTPFLFASGTGALTRAAMKPSFAANYGIPVGVGAVEGAIAANAPLGTDAYILPPAYNPVRAGYEAGARELPASDPRRAEWIANADREPVENPVRSQASKEFYDPAKLAERTLFGLAEGGVGGLAGAKAPAVLGRIGSSIAELPGLVLNRLGLRQGTPAQSLAAAADAASGANGLATRPIAEPASSAEVLPPSRNALAGPGRLADRVKANPVLEPARPANQRGDIPEWASEAPEGVKLPRGYFWDTKMQQPRHKDGTLGEMPKYSAPRVRREGAAGMSPTAEEPRSVQIDDMRPLRYRNNLDPED
jgi:hypothetical protein